MSKIKFSGIYSALPTPLAEDGTVNAEVAIRLMRDQLAQGVKGFYVAGGTGEGVLLHKEQRMAIAETAVEACRGRGQVIVHTGAINVEDALELTRHAFSRPRWKSRLSVLCERLKPDFVRAFCKKLVHSERLKRCCLKYAIPVPAQS